ncbi:hypothetical protein HO173_001446 [Letharia columbiana]|uniref:Uncharacterized protein n=1 Tax=Letharia columbiana TaxID=112416 RepID=A0A8H6L9R4_9LECA|nr:uncharacterized protein HO173_001446 [Letharia columbiana]KAF6240773.1 hypothetical protein HO173_001446 [Letharia columbiana]
MDPVDLPASSSASHTGTGMGQSSPEFVARHRTQQQSEHATLAANWSARKTNATRSEPNNPSSALVLAQFWPERLWRNMRRR